VQGRRSRLRPNRYPDSQATQGPRFDASSLPEGARYVGLSKMTFVHLAAAVVKVPRS